jgi:hypothetical protein
MDYGIVEAMRGFPLHTSQMYHLPPKSDIRSWIIVSPFFLAIVYANSLLLNKARVEYYGKIFHGWNKQKRMRWKIYVLLVGALSFVLLFLVGEIHQSLLQP